MRLLVILAVAWLLAACESSGEASACGDVECGQVTCPTGKVARTREGECCPVCVPKTQSTTSSAGGDGAGAGGTGTTVAGAGGSGAGAGGGGTTGGATCGSKQCGAEERCCDPCTSKCVFAAADVLCPADSGEVSCDGDGEPSAGCPASMPSRGARCSEQGSTCDYGDTQCACSQCDNAPGGVECPANASDGTLAWHCPTEQPGCPPACAGCAAPDTPIATPDGERPIAELREGDLVYSLDGDGVVVVPVLRTSRTAVEHHSVVRVALASGRVLHISAVHPAADGRAFSELREGTLLDGVAVESAELVPYPFAYTHDILPASVSGAYFAAGVAIGSTLGGVPVQ